MIEIAKLERMLKTETAADAWWDGLSKKEQQAYIKAHPRSRYAKHSGPMLVDSPQGLSLRKPTTRRPAEPKPRAKVDPRVPGAHEALVGLGLTHKSGKLFKREDGSSMHRNEYAVPKGTTEDNVGDLLGKAGYKKKTDIVAGNKFDYYKHKNGDEVWTNTKGLTNNVSHVVHFRGKR